MVVWVWWDAVWDKDLRKAKGAGTPVQGMLSKLGQAQQPIPDEKYLEGMGLHASPLWTVGGLLLANKAGRKFNQWLRQSKLVPLQKDMQGGATQLFLRALVGPDHAVSAPQALVESALFDTMAPLAVVGLLESLLWSMGAMPGRDLIDLGRKAFGLVG